jgi:hypothetical protein
MIDSSLLDAALERQRELGPEYGAGLSSHVPMVLEALERMGRSDAIAPYIDAWVPRLRPLSPATDPELDAYPALLAETTTAISTLGPRGAVAASFARWAPGLHGAAFHGLLRVAHAVRGLDRADTSARRAELAAGLAYAVARAAAPFSACVSVGDGSRPLLERGMSSLVPSARAGEGRSGLITADFIARLGAGDAFERAAGQVTLSDDLAGAARALRLAALTLFVNGRRHPSASFVLLHGVTGADAISALVPWLDPRQSWELVRYMATAIVGLRVAYVTLVPDAVVEGSPEDGVASELVDRAVRSGDDHAIKLAAACIEGARDVPDARWPQALRQTIGH